MTTSTTTTYETIGTTPAGRAVAIARAESRHPFRASPEVRWSVVEASATDDWRRVAPAASQRAARAAAEAYLAAEVRRVESAERADADRAEIAALLGIDVARVALRFRPAQGSLTGSSYDPARARILVDDREVACGHAETTREALARAVARLRK